MNVMNIMKFAYSVEISLHSLMNSLMRLNESNEFINELNEWLMKFIKMTFCPKKYFIVEEASTAQMYYIFTPKTHHLNKWTGVALLDHL